MFSIQNVLSKCKGCQNFEREREARKNYQWKYICELSDGENIVNFVQQK